MRKRIIVLSFIVTVISTLVYGTTAQETRTATPAPSKTPRPTATMSPPQQETAVSVAEETPTVRANINTTELRQYTQNDLNILVGNVQRPNGLAWLNNNLYAVCSGDFTLYEIHSETGATVTFASGVRDANVIWTEETEAGFNLWIPDFDTNQLLRADHLRGLPTAIVDENLDGPWGLAPMDEEYFLITNALADNVVLANRDGTSSVVMENLRYPTGIVVDGAYGYVANRGSARRAIEWFAVEDIEADEASDELTQPLVSGLQNVSNLVMAQDDYLYFTFALAERGVVGRVNPEECRDGGCTNEQVEIVVLTDGRTAPLAGLTISEDMRLFVHTVYDSEIFWVQLYDE